MRCLTSDTAFNYMYKNESTDRKLIIQSGIYGPNKAHREVQGSQENDGHHAGDSESAEGDQVSIYLCRIG